MRWMNAWDSRAFVTTHTSMRALRGRCVKQRSLLCAASWTNRERREKAKQHRLHNDSEMRHLVTIFGNVHWSSRKIWRITALYVSFIKQMLTYVVESMANRLKIEEIYKNISDCVMFLIRWCGVTVWRLERLIVQTWCPSLPQAHVRSGFEDGRMSNYG